VVPNDHDVGHPLLPLPPTVVFKIGNAEFDLADWACERYFDLAGDAVE
jgi:hypothetical protein